MSHKHRENLSRDAGGNLRVATVATAETNPVRIQGHGFPTDLDARQLINQSRAAAAAEGDETVPSDASEQDVSRKKFDKKIGCNMDI